MSRLAETTCTACRGDEPPLDDARIAQLLEQVPGWHVAEEGDIKSLRREFRFADFAHALSFTDEVGELAEEQGHHPSLLTEWGKVTVTWFTHSISGLHHNDFVMAAKTSQAYGS